MTNEQRKETLEETLQQLDATPYSIALQHNITPQLYHDWIGYYSTRSELLRQRLSTGKPILKFVQPMFEEAKNEYERKNAGFFNSGRYLRIVNDLVENLIGKRGPYHAATADLENLEYLYVLNDVAWAPGINWFKKLGRLISHCLLWDVPYATFNFREQFDAPIPRKVLRTITSPIYHIKWLDERIDQIMGSPK